jgi:hypothetical protein
VLQQTGRGREDEVGRRRADDDEFDLADVDASGVEGRAGRALSKVGRGLAFRGDMALADAGAAVDPFVGRVDELFQVRVGQDLLRQIAAGACDTGMNQSGFPLNRSTAPRPGGSGGVACKRIPALARRNYMSTIPAGVRPE